MSGTLTARPPHRCQIASTYGHHSSVSTQRDSDKPARVGVGNRLGSTHRADGTRQSESGASRSSKAHVRRADEDPHIRRANRDVHYGACSGRSCRADRQHGGTFGDGPAPRESKSAQFFALLAYTALERQCPTRQLFQPCSEDRRCSLIVCGSRASLDFATFFRTSTCPTTPPT